jgi:hypothetical protein
MVRFGLNSILGSRAVAAIWSVIFGAGLIYSNDVGEGEETQRIQANASP